MRRSRGFTPIELLYDDTDILSDEEASGSTLPVFAAARAWGHLDGGEVVGADAC